MSGHSKWHTIRRSKGAADQKRGQLFTKLARDITVAVRDGGNIGDPDMNFRLRLAIDKAKQNNMPADSIQRAIDRGTGKGNEGMEEVVYYEGYAPGGVALLIEAATNNRNRTSSDVRSTMTKNGANPGEPGSVSWMFEQKGLITIDLNGTSFDPDDVMLQAIDAGAEEVEETDDSVMDIYTEWTQLNDVRQALMNFPITNVEITMRPTTMIQPGDEKDALQVMRLLEKLEDLDDVQRVYSNLDISDELASKYE